MTRLIDADALLERIKKDPLFPLVEEYGISGVIKAEPTVEAEPVRHGRWIGGELGECSVCGHHGCASDIWNDCANQYCPNCGAKMDEVEHETD